MGEPASRSDTERMDWLEERLSPVMRLLMTWLFGPAFTWRCLRDAIDQRMAEERPYEPVHPVPAYGGGYEGPACANCGSITVRTGSCYTCRNCGWNTGCG